ncbi:MAG: alpha/beta hydrolase [Bacteroidota bacterium]|nr:alpha/beta hydrolase [Bacteroidota bacterium]
MQNPFSKISIAIVLLSNLFLGSCNSDRVPDQEIQADNRYLETVFDNIDVTESVIYGNQPEEHWMNVYEPHGDRLESRPLVILAPGGGFNPDMIAHSYDLLIPLAEKLAHAGYLVALINYRTGETNSHEKYKKAFYTALYDLKAAIRYFRKDADTANRYRADADKIFTGGWSAGAQIGLFNAFVNSTDELSPSNLIELNEYEGLEGESGNPGYSSHVSGMIAMAGNMADISRIKTGDPIIMCIHSDTDYTVHIDTEEGPFGTAYGSRPIIARAKEVNIKNQFIEIEGGTHTAPIKPDCPTCFDQIIRFIGENLWE